MDNRVKKKCKKRKIKYKLYIPPHLRESSLNSIEQFANSDSNQSEEKLCNNSHLLFQTYEDKEVFINNKEFLTNEDVEVQVTTDISRPKPCSATIKRIVSGALGVKAVISDEEREMELEMIRHFKDRRKNKICL